WHPPPRGPVPPSGFPQGGGHLALLAQCIVGRFCAYHPAHRGGSNRYAPVDHSPRGFRRVDRGVSLVYKTGNRGHQGGGRGGGGIGNRLVTRTTSRRTLVVLLFHINP